MVLKRAKLFVYDNDEYCTEVKQFLEDSGIFLEIRDLKKDPFSYDEITNLVGFLKINHFLNKKSDAYNQHKLDKASLSREEMIQLILNDQSLLRSPIVKAARLIIIGHDKQKISEMLQIKANEKLEEKHKNTSNRKSSMRNNNRKRTAMSN